MKQTLFVLILFLLQQTQAPQQTGSIEGSVVKFGTTEAIPRAKVTLNPAQGGGAQATLADNEGQFAFRNLSPGQYRLTVTRDGYIAAEYGQRGPSSSGVPLALASQQQLRDVRVGMTPSGAIAGRIINRYGEPVGNANIQALRYTYQEGKRVLTPVQSVRTNDLGEYRLFWMAPGQYIVSAQPTEQLALDAGGTVFFTSVQGAGPGAMVGALTGAQLGVGGVTRITVTGGGARGAGGRGDGLPPPPPAPPGGVPADNAQTYLPVYYPGTTDVTAASPVDLRAGGNIGGVNLMVVEARPVRIRGQVLNGGRAAAGAQVMIYQRSNISGNLTIRSTTVTDAGTFEFRSVAPGSYELAATLNAPGPAALLVGGPLGNAAGLTAANAGAGRGATVPGQPTMAGRVPVDVVNSDVDGVSLLLESGFNVTGKVTIEGRTAAEAETAFTVMGVQLQSDPVIPPLAVPAAAPGADGSVSITGVTPGQYRLSILNPPRGTYVKAARLGGVDVLNGGVRIDGEPRGSLDIVLGSNPGSLDAVVLDDLRGPVAAATVVLVPDITQQKRYNAYRNATSDASGRIHLDGVIPGDYRIYAWEDVETNAWTDPDFIRIYQNSGVAVRVGEGGRAAVDVPVIPYKVN